MISNNEDLAAAKLLASRARLSYSYALELVRDFRKGVVVDNPALRSAVETWCLVSDDIIRLLNSEKRLLDYSIIALTPDEIDTILKRGRSDNFVLLRLDSKIHDPKKITYNTIESVLENSRVIDYDHTLILEDRNGVGAGVYKLTYRTGDPAANPFDTNETYLYGVEMKKILRYNRDDIESLSIE